MLFHVDIQTRPASPAVLEYVLNYPLPHRKASEALVRVQKFARDMALLLHPCSPCLLPADATAKWCVHGLDCYVGGMSCIALVQAVYVCSMLQTTA